MSALASHTHTAAGGVEQALASLRSRGGEGLVQELSKPLERGERPEQRLLELGVVSDRDLALEIAISSGRPFTALRGVEPDPKLFLYVPLELAERELVFPLILIGDSLTVASAFLDPDLGLVQWRFPNLQVELAIAPCSEIRDALTRARRELV